MIKYANLLFVSILFNLSVYGAVIAPQQGGGTAAGGSATNAQPPSTILTNLSSLGITMVFSNTIIVQATANALTNGILLTNAVKTAGTLATGGRTILVHVTRGEYWTPTNTLPSVMMAVENVSTYWEPGAKWYSGKVTAGSDTAHMWDDSAGKRTNVNIYGWGEFYLTNNSASVVSLEAGSTMTVECQEVFASESDSASSGGATTFNFLTLPATFTANVRGTIHSVTYDAIYFNAIEGHKVNIKARKISSTFGDILEASGSAANWGDVVIEADVMERTATTGATYLGTAYVPQPSMMKIGGNVIIRAGSINCYSTNGSIYSGSLTNYGLLANAVIKVAGNSRRGVIDDGSATFTAQTGVWLKNCSLYGPTNLDVMNLTNVTALPTILDNCTIYPGFAATNWARGYTPSKVLILGTLNVFPNLPAGPNITVVGTNTTSSLVTDGTVTAQSFIGSGASTPYLLLSSPNGAAFGLSVNTNLTVQTTNNLDFASAAAGQAMVLHSAAAGQLVWTNATASAGGGSTTNVPPVVLAINGGTGSTNVIIDMWVLAQMSTNSVQLTLTANAGIVVTNVVAGKELVIDVIQDSTGNRTIAVSSVGGAPLRFGTDITGFGLSTNGTYKDHIKLRGVGTNAHVVGMLRGYAP